MTSTNLTENAIECGFDKLKMFFGETYVVNDAISIYEVTIQEIVDFGEEHFFACIAPFVSNPTTYRLQLWDMGIDWCELSDFDLFCMLAPTLQPEITCILFGRYDFTNLQLMMRKDTEERVLYDPITDTVVDNATYIIMREYIRMMMNQYPRREFTRGKQTKLALIDEDRINIRNAERKRRIEGGRKVESYLFSLISTMLITPGFKYKKNELREVNIAEFMISVEKFQVFKATESLLRGMYSGFLDTSKIDTQKELNWFRES